MRLRTFTASDMPGALSLVREALGDRAIILSSESHPDRQLVSVTAAVEEDDEESMLSPAQVPSAMARSDAFTDNLRQEVQTILRFHNLPELFVAKIMQKANNNDLATVTGIHKISAKTSGQQLHRLALEKLLAGFFAFSPLPFESKSRLMLVGAPGIGKTLTIAKIATRIAMQKEKLTVITTDNKRAGGIEQLQAFTTILGIPLLVASNLEELQKHASTANSNLLIDTAGCNPYDADEMKELESYAALAGIEPVLAMQAGTDSMEAIDMAEAFSNMSIRRLIITRADTARRFGGVLASAAAHGLSFSNASASSSVIDPLMPMDAALLAQLLLRYQLQS